jgi:hypothetical protein
VALLGATGQLVARRIDRNAWRQAFSIHNPIVIALGAIPGFGAFAYLAAGPIRSNRLLMRVTVDAVMMKLPWRLYERTGMRRVIVIGRAERTRGATAPAPIPAPLAIPTSLRSYDPVMSDTGFDPIPVGVQVAAFARTSLANPSMARVYTACGSERRSVHSWE